MAKLQATYEIKEVDGGWEYEVTLWRGLKIVDIYDSEISNGEQEHPLTKQVATAAAKEIVADVKRGMAEHWFQEVSCGAST